MAQLEIVFYGMACFDEQNDGTYRVLFPNGKNHRYPHVASVWVRDRNELARVRWPWIAARNDYLVEEPAPLEITGVRKTKLNTDEFKGRLSNCRESDPNFTIAEDPDAIIDMRVDRGVLSAHKHGDWGMIVVRWMLEPDGRSPVTFNFGSYSIELTAGTTQVLLANVGKPLDPHSGETHFALYRMLATEREGDLRPRGPQKDPAPPISLKDPTSGYFTLMTPDGGCSPSFSK